MIFDMKGSSVSIDNKTFQVGSAVIANMKSVYKGLTGTILSIRTGEDTFNPRNDVDISVCFDCAQHPHIINQIENNFMPDNRCMEYEQPIEYSSVVLTPDRLDTFFDLFEE